MRKLFIPVAVVMFCLLYSGIARTQTPAALDANKSKINEPAIKLTDEDKSEIRQVKDQYSQLLQQQVTLEAQLDATRARLAGLQSSLAAKFNRLCAKAKLDPDLYQWTKDLDGIEPKPKP